MTRLLTETEAEEVKELQNFRKFESQLYSDLLDIRTRIQHAIELGGKIKKRSISQLPIMPVDRNARYEQLAIQQAYYLNIEKKIGDLLTYSTQVLHKR